MPPFDTLKITIPTLYTSKNEDKFIEDLDKKGNKSYLLRTSEKVVGLNSLRIGTIDTAIDFSAKILKVNYPKLLTAETIEEALTNILNVGAITFDVHEVLDIARAKKGHQAKDFLLSRPFTEYLGLLDRLHVNRSYTKNYFDNETITFIQNIKTAHHRDYLKIYDKHIEYLLNKNADYRETLTKKEKELVSQYFKNKIRIEAEYNSKAKLRQHFPDIHKDILLKDLLLSTSDPMAELYNEITAPIYKQMESTQTIKSLDYLTTLNYKKQLIFNSLEKHDFDLNRINHWLKSTCIPRTAQRQQKEYAEAKVKYLAHYVTSDAPGLLNELKAAITAPPTDSNNYINNRTFLSPIQQVVVTEKSAASKVPNLTTSNNYINNQTKMSHEAAIEKELERIGYTKEKRKADEEFWESMKVGEPLEADWLPF